MSKWIFSVIFLTVLFCAVSGYGDNNPIIFSREQIVIIPKTEPEIIVKPTANDADKKPEPKPQVRNKKTLDVQIQPENYLYQPGMMSLKLLQDKSIILITVQNPKTTLRRTNIYSPLDVVFVSPEGIITQIAPKLLLSELATPIASSKPVRAYLLLAGGEAEKLDIHPGDRIEHALFAPKPQLVQ